MPASVFSLPVSLILLIHLHLLQYPHANKPEYDHNIFDARVRGFRDRTRAMEDVCYFLVSRIEGSKERVRKVIPIYPCLQPGDSTAFRTCLAKFLQDLRHSSVFPAGPSGHYGQPNVKTVPPLAEVKAVAWWWKDVVVRKSLLEECAGEKFERLVLALSTHALLRGSATRIEPHETLLLRSQPRVYVTQLASFQACHNSWSRAASALNKRQYDVRALRANVQAHSRSSKYSSLSTEKLVAVADSKLRDALSAHWSGASGHSALRFLAEMLQLKPLASSPPATGTINGVTAPTPPSSLPIAAAHHPSTLRKLSQKIFLKTVVAPTHPTVAVASRPHAAIVLAVSVDAEDRMRQALADRLSRTRKITDELKARLARAVTQNSTHQHAPRSVDMNLWKDVHQMSVDFEPTSSVDALTSSMRDSTVTLRTRINEIRGSLLPKFPPDPSSVAQPTTGLPHPEKKKSPPQTPRSARRLETVTVPETVKPQARYAPGRVGSDRPMDETDRLSHFSKFGAQSDFDGMDAMTPRARRQDSPPLSSPSMRALDTYPMRSETQHDSEDDFDNFGEGPSMSVRDLLLQADTTHFEIIDDVSSELNDQSFGWA
ncbi:hypothetical protein B0H12DRAFT_1326620 [Mycena haematopus]|nr:hypothetical protein B0H12DRAFT_1326620 [Mycena haematopus]